VFAGRVDPGSSDKILAILNTEFQKRAVLSVSKFPGEIQRQTGLGITTRASLESVALSGCGIDRRKPYAFGAVTNDRS